MELVPSDLATYLAGGEKLCEYRILFPLHDVQMTNDGSKQPNLKLFTSPVRSLMLSW